ncbi:MAG TPA: hypothetical protein P5270_09875, partial [Victivallales bacterium]|nr:hypothetical protein [Victivallales bacterium]
SPSRIAWEAKKVGLFSVGIVDFDVIDGMDEFIDAAELLSLRASVGVETRSFFAKFANFEMDSPGEPGVNYVMGVGFTQHFPDESVQAKKLTDYRENAKKRNLNLIKRINEKLKDIALSYEEDVIPLTPSGNATERHIITAYGNKALKKLGDKAFSYLSEILERKSDEIKNIFYSSRPGFDELLRSKLVKKGGIGYLQPSKETFPPMDEFLQWVKSCGAIPTEAWLDGTTNGEALGLKYIEASKAEGAMAINIIPDRNWNIKDSQTQKIKLAKLKEIVDAANTLNMPIFIGTEMNKSGQPLYDDLDCNALRPFKQTFIRGASIAIGHSILARFAKLPYSADATDNIFKSTEEKNDFYEKVGKLPPLNKKISENLSKFNPDEIFAKIADSAKKGCWNI